MTKRKQEEKIEIKLSIRRAGFLRWGGSIKVSEYFWNLKDGINFLGKEIAALIKGINWEEGKRE